MFSLYKSLRNHRRLAEKRDVNYENNRVAKFFIGLTLLVVAVYLIGAAILLAMIANDSRRVSAVELLCTVTPFILTIDFFVRFMAQQTPAQIIRPYSLLPIPMQTCINGFIFSSVLSWGNLIWFCLVVPYILMSVLFGYGIITAINLCCFFFIAVLANSQWYAIVRTLVNVNFVYWLLPVAIYAIVYAPLYIGSDAGFDQYSAIYGRIGEAIESHSIYPLLCIIMSFVAIICINASIQRIFVKQELQQTGKVKEKHIGNFSFLNRFGETGLFLKLEIKTILRNKNPRKSFILSVLATIALSAVITFTDVYDSNLMTNFWAFYNFVLFGSIILIRGLGN